MAEIKATSDPAHGNPSAGRRIPTSDDLEVSTYLEIARQREGEQPRQGEPQAPTQPVVSQSEHSPT